MQAIADRDASAPSERSVCLTIDSLDGDCPPERAAKGTTLSRQRYGGHRNGLAGEFLPPGWFTARWTIVTGPLARLPDGGSTPSDAQTLALSWPRAPRLSHRGGRSQISRHVAFASQAPLVVGGEPEGHDLVLGSCSDPDKQSFREQDGQAQTVVRVDKQITRKALTALGQRCRQPPQRARGARRDRLVRRGDRRC